MNGTVLLRTLYARHPARVNPTVRIKLRSCPLHGSQCKAQPMQEFAMSHSDIPKLSSPKFIFV